MVNIENPAVRSLAPSGWGMPACLRACTPHISPSFSTSQEETAHPKASRQREESDSYSSVAALLNQDWRVIVCRDGIQWILQRRAGMRHGQPRWDSRSYCRTRSGLVRAIRENCEAPNLCRSRTVERLPKVTGGES